MSPSKKLNLHEQLEDAACSGNSRRVEHLLEKGANPNYQDPTLKFNSPLMWAVTHGHIETAEILLRAGADVNLVDSLGGSALLVAAANGDAPMLRFLLSAGANREHKDADGNDALAFARHNNHDEAIKILKEWV